MKIKVSDVSAFRSILLCITRFIEKAHFDVQKTGIRIRSIDKHDFCYIDLFLKQEFFEGYNLNGEMLSFGINSIGLRNILLNIKKNINLFLEISDGKLRFHLVGNRRAIYNLDWLPIDPYKLPRVRKLNYDTNVNVPSMDFLSLVKEAATVSPEIFLSTSNGKLKATSVNDDLSYTSEINLRDGDLKIKTVKMYVIIDYLRRLYEIISMSDSVNLSLSEKLPFKISIPYNDKGSFSFIISNRKINEDIKGNNDVVLPEISSTRLPELLEFIEKSYHKADLRSLPLSDIENESNENSKVAVALGLAVTTDRYISLTRQGKRFISLLEKNPRAATKELHTLALKKIPSYAAIIEAVTGNSLSTTEIYENVNSLLKAKSIPQIGKHELMALLGLATWCKVIDRKIGLSYFETGVRL